MRTSERPTFKSSLTQLIKTIDRRYELREHGTVHSLERVFGGRRPGTVVVLAGARGTGKTALALNLALSAAREAPVLMISLETSSSQLLERILSIEAQLDASNLASGALDAKAWVGVTKACGLLSNLPITVEDRTPMSRARIEKAVNKWAAGSTRSRNGIIVIDGMRRLSGKVDEWLTKLAQRSNACVIVTTGISSEADTREEHRPMLTDVRPRALERVADVLALLYRPELDAADFDEKDRGVVEVVLAKNDAGPRTALRLRFDSACSRYASEPL